MKPLSPTALSIQAVLVEFEGTWNVRDDEHTDAVLINDWAVRWCIHLTGSWVEPFAVGPGSPDGVPPQVLRAIEKALPYEPYSGRGLRHYEWRRRERSSV